MGRRRPLLGLALAWIFGVAWAGTASPLPDVALAVGALGLLGANLAVALGGGGERPLLVLALVATVAAWAYEEARLPFDRLDALAERMEEVHGAVVSFPVVEADRLRYRLAIDGLPGAVQVVHHHDRGAFADLAYGDRVTIESQPEGTLSLTDPDYRAFLTARDVWALVPVWHPAQARRRPAAAGHPVLRWGYATRGALIETIDRHIPDPQSGLLVGMLFGERAYLADRVERDFRNAGAMHVLAVSGLHLAILLGLGWFVLRRLGRSATQTYLALLAGAVGYLAIVGFKLSLVRATLMLAFVALGWVVAERGWILKRWVDPIQGLSAAVLLLLVLHPPTLFDVSFQLSAAATAGILVALNWMSPILQAQRDRLTVRFRLDASRARGWLLRGGERLVTLGVITAAAQLSVAPVIAWHFERAHLGAFLANLAIVPLVTLALAWAVAFLLAAGLGLGPLTAILGTLVSRLLAGLIDATSGFASLPWAYVVVDRAALLALLVLVPLAVSSDVVAWVQHMAHRWGLAG